MFTLSTEAMLLYSIGSGFGPRLVHAIVTNLGSVLVWGILWSRIWCLSSFGAFYSQGSGFDRHLAHAIVTKTVGDCLFGRSVTSSVLAVKQSPKCLDLAYGLACSVFTIAQIPDPMGCKKKQTVFCKKSADLREKWTPYLEMK